MEGIRLIPIGFRETSSFQIRTATPGQLARVGSSVFTAEKAIAIIEEELTGEHPGRIVFAKEKPAAAIVGRARGHKQVMDFWLVQLARQEGCKLATLDEGTLANWPDVAVRV